ncbi:hypothetical protein EON66_04840 [archaeon]|nr:MAG: hypothetical protein EON66_04840 [archaeon]
MQGVRCALCVSQTVRPRLHSQRNEPILQTSSVPPPNNRITRVRPLDQSAYPRAHLLPPLLLGARQDGVHFNFRV